MKSVTFVRTIITASVLFTAAVLIISARSKTETAAATKTICPQEKCSNAPAEGADVKLHVMSFHLDELL